MNQALAAGVLLTLLGLAGYGVGTAVSYPGRAFSLTALMVGVTLVLVSRQREATA